MLVVLDARLFGDPGVRELELLSLVQLCIGRRHHAALTDPLLDGRAPSSVVRWLEDQSPPVAAELRRYFTDVALDLVASSRAGGRRIRVEPREQSRWEGPVPVLTVSDAIRLMTRPLKLLVEDRTSDFAFLRAAAPPQWRAELEHALAEGTIDVEHGGGIGNMKARVHDAITSPDPLDRTRLWVMCDSDRRAPDEPNAASEALVDACHSGMSPWPIPCRQLRRRSIENYLPVPWLRRWPYVTMPERRNTNHRVAMERAVKVIERRLDAAQRAHYNFKAGLLGDIRVDKKARSRALRDGGATIDDDDLHRIFRTLSDEDRRALHDGLGDDVASMFQFSSDFRSRHGLEDAALHDELPSDEVETLLTSIFDGI